MKRIEQSYGEVRSSKDGKEEFVRPPRYLWLIKYNESKNSFSFDDYGPFLYTKENEQYGNHGEKYKFYQSKTPFFMEGCVCAYCVAENEKTALDRVFGIIMEAISEKNRFLGEFAVVRAKESKDLENISSQDIFREEDGKASLPFPWWAMRKE